MGINARQYETLMKPLNPTRVANRQQSGKQLSYLESWDVRAHLIRVFGFGNFDAEIIEVQPVYQRDITIGKDDNEKPGWEVAYLVVFSLTIRDENGEQVAKYTESAVGSASGSVGLGDLHDNALKTAASDALKRCAINLGTQFGLSLYDNGSRNEIVKGTLVTPDGVAEKPKPSEEQQAALSKALGHEAKTEEPMTEEQVAAALEAGVVETEQPGKQGTMVEQAVARARKAQAEREAATA